MHGMTFHIGRVVSAAALPCGGTTLHVSEFALVGAFTSDLTHNDSRNEKENGLRRLFVQIDLMRK